MKKIYLFLIIYFCLFPFNCFCEELVPNGKSAILVEASTGKILFEKNINDKLSIASLTKMVAQIIILEEVENGNIKWNDIVTCSKNASDMGGSQIYLSAGEKMSVEDLMKGVSVASGNDATVCLAEYISGSEEKFVKKMNLKVKELGLKNTHFSNCTGLDQDNHYSSAYDLSIISRELVNNHSEIFKFSSIYEDYLRKDTSNKFWLVNTNKLVNFYEGTDGLKTGHTDNAGYCLSTTTKRNGIRLIGIILGENNSKVRNNEMVNLMDYGFNNISSKKILDKNKFSSSINVKHSNKNKIAIGIMNDLIVYEDKDNNNKYDVKYKYDSIKLPIKKNDKVGDVSVVYNNKVILKEDLIALENVSKENFFDLFINNLLSLIFGNM